MDGEANKALQHYVQRGLCVPGESGGAGEQGHPWGGPLIFCLPNPDGPGGPGWPTGPGLPGGPMTPAGPMSPLSP